MEIIDIHEAGSQLSRLIERALAGEDVMIARDGTPVVRLGPVSPNVGPRVGGQWRGKIWIAEDFDELPPDIAAVFGMIDE